MQSFVTTWRQYWDPYEAALGLMAAFVLAFGPLTVATLALIFSLCLGEWSVAAIAGVVVGVTCPMALWLASMVDSALKQFRSERSCATGNFILPSLPVMPSAREYRSFAIVLASTLPTLPRLARLPLGIWWLVHFLAGSALVYFANSLAQQGILWNGFCDGVGGFVFGYLFHFAANVFLLLAVAAVFGSPCATARVWHARFFLDGLATLPLLLRIVF